MMQESIYENINIAIIFLFSNLSSNVLIPASAPRLVLKKKGCGMCYPVCGMLHIKEPLLLIGKSSIWVVLYHKSNTI